MRTLKIAVIVMGVMLVVGFVALIALVTHRLSHPPAAQTATTATAASAARPEQFTAPPVDLPSGSHIETIAMGADRLALAVVLADGTRQIIILDAANGHRIGLIPLGAAP